MMNYKEHHIWCNYTNREVSKCKQCKRLYELYPINDETDSHEILKKYFPEVYEMNKDRIEDGGS